MAKRIRVERGYGNTFDYKGGTVYMSAMRWNIFTFCWICDFRYNDVSIKGLCIRGGVNILGQYGIPFNIYVVNAADVELDPIKFSGIRLFIIEPGDLSQVIDDSNILVNV